MSYENLMYISIGAGIVLLTISIIFFIYYRIPDVISDLTGRTAKREIEAMQSASRSTGKIRTKVTGGKKEKSTAELSRTNSRGWLVRKARKKTTPLEEEDKRIPHVGKENGQGIVSQSEPVFQKDMSGGTIPLANVPEGTMPLQRSAEGTMPLSNTLNGSVPVPSEEPSAPQTGTELLQRPTAGDLREGHGFTIKKRILVTHTEEQI